MKDENLAVNQTVQEAMMISSFQNATQGTYLVELSGLAVPRYFVLTVWNGHGEWPVLPMLAAESNYIVCRIQIPEMALWCG